MSAQDDLRPKYDIRSEVIREDRESDKQELADLESDVDDYFESLTAMVEKVRNDKRRDDLVFWGEPFTTEATVVSFCLDCEPCGQLSSVTRRVPQSEFEELVFSVSLSPSEFPEDCALMALDKTRRQIMATKVTWTGSNLTIENRSNLTNRYRAAKFASSLKRALKEDAPSDQRSLGARVRKATRVASESNQLVMETSISRNLFEE